jgi:hypothetical protein
MVARCAARRSATRSRRRSDPHDDKRASGRPAGQQLGAVQAVNAKNRRSGGRAQRCSVSQSRRVAESPCREGAAALAARGARRRGTRAPCAVRARWLTSRRANDPPSHIARRHPPQGQRGMHIWAMPNSTSNHRCLDLRRIVPSACPLRCLCCSREGCTARRAAVPPQRLQPACACACACSGLRVSAHCGAARNLVPVRATYIGIGLIQARYGSAGLAHIIAVGTLCAALDRHFSILARPSSFPLSNSYCTETPRQPAKSWLRARNHVA